MYYRLCKGILQPYRPQTTLKLVIQSYLVSVLISNFHSSNTSLGKGLFITLKAERESPDWLWGAVAQWSEHRQLKQEALGSIPSGCPGFFFSFSWLTNVDGMKDLWCSSTVWLLSKAPSILG